MLFHIKLEVHHFIVSSFACSAVLAQLGPKALALAWLEVALAC